MKTHLLIKDQSFLYPTTYTYPEECKNSQTSKTKNSKLPLAALFIDLIQIFLKQSIWIIIEL
jgi:hypothetical protein